MDFTRKARWVKDGHKTPDPKSLSFAGVLSRDSIRIALTHAALLGLPVMGADIRNAYLQAPSSEKHLFIICGPEFGIQNEGRVALEIDVSPELGEADASFFHSLIGVLRWIVELGRVDLDVEVSMLSSHLALPHEGRMK